jgi:hypothetical protein
MAKKSSILIGIRDRMDDTSITSSRHGRLRVAVCFDGIVLVDALRLPTGILWCPPRRNLMAPI